MWAQYAAIKEQSEPTESSNQWNQLFLTKNKVLQREVERSFNNMSLAWTKKIGPSTESKDKDSARVNTTFLSSSEWLEALDMELPGDSFFTPSEVESRIESRRVTDTVAKGVEEFLTDRNKVEAPLQNRSDIRQEATFLTFRKMWRKLKSGSSLDCVLVWREIKSFIKGSVRSLHIDRSDRCHFLSLQEYLDLPRKQSRLDAAKRREVYGVFLKYEKLKKSGNLYDECDLVFNIAGRIALGNIATPTSESVLPIDSVFVDEVQG